MREWEAHDNVLNFEKKKIIAKETIYQGEVLENGVN